MPAGSPCRVLALILTGVASRMYFCLCRLPSWARWTCVIFYVVCKALIYALFVEKAYLAKRFMYRGPRLGNALFRKLFVMWCLYLALLCFHAVAEYTPQLTTNGTLPEPGALGKATLLDGYCSFYVEPPASVPIVVYDLVFTSTLVHWFAKPLLEATRHGREVSGKSRHQTEIEATTKKSLRGALITLLASFLDIMSLALFCMVYRWFERMRAAM